MIGVRSPLPVLPFCLEKFFKYFPYFLIGMILAFPQHISINKRLLRKYSQPLLIMLLSIVLIAISIRLMNFGGWKNHLFVVIQCVVLPIIPIVFFLWMKGKANSKENSTWRNLDRWSMGIYVVHHIYIQKMNAVLPFHDWMIGYPWVYPQAMFFVVLIMSVVTVWLLQRFKYGKYIVG